MKTVQPQSDEAPPNDDPGDPSEPKGAGDPATPTRTETDPMPRMSRHSRNAAVDFCGRKRTNANHGPVTDPDARLYRKSPGTGPMLCFVGGGSESGPGTVFPTTAPIENRSGLIGRGDLSRADGHTGRRAAIGMIHRHIPGPTRRPRTEAGVEAGVDRGFDAAGFVAGLREACGTPRIAPQVAQRSRHSAINDRTPAIKVTSDRNATTNDASKRPSAGPKPSVAWPGPSAATSKRCAPASPWPPTILSDCRGCGLPEGRITNDRKANS